MEYIYVLMIQMTRIAPVWYFFRDCTTSIALKFLVSSGVVEILIIQE